MAKKMWGGRFGKKTDPLAEELTKSIHYDYKLAEYDVMGSMAHVEILKKAKYLTAPEASKLTKGLKTILDDVAAGKFIADPCSEDIHTDIQNKLQAKVGDLALKLHTARSRNDQVVFATKQYCRANIKEAQKDLQALISALSAAAAKNNKIIIPGFTHMQHAQPVYLKDYIGSYAAMLARDADRLSYIHDHIKLTMGSGALAGTPIKAANYKAGKIDAPENSLDTVSDRDFVIEIITALSIIAMHLSRLAEDLIIWSTGEFDFVEMDEAYCTGSSLMPHKKNPDALELIRGYAGRVYGNLVSVLTMMKGLPLTYNRDMQLDKEPLFSSFEIVSAELKIMAGMIKTLKFNKTKIEGQLKDESLYATDLVYYLVKKGIAFKDAHTIVGRLVKYSIDSGVLIKNIPEAGLKRFSGKFVKKEVNRLFDPKVSVESKKSVKR